MKTQPLQGEVFHSIMDKKNSGAAGRHYRPSLIPGGGAGTARNPIILNGHLMPIHCLHLQRNEEHIILFIHCLLA